jgi:hypothetical protein
MYNAVPPEQRSQMEALIQMVTKTVMTNVDQSRTMGGYKASMEKILDTFVDTVDQLVQTTNFGLSQQRLIRGESAEATVASMIPLLRDHASRLQLLATMKRSGVTSRSEEAEVISAQAGGTGTSIPPPTDPFTAQYKAVLLSPLGKAMLDGGKPSSPVPQVQTQVALPPAVPTPQVQAPPVSGMMQVPVQQQQQQQQQIPTSPYPSYQFSAPGSSFFPNFPFARPGTSAVGSQLNMLRGLKTPNTPTPTIQQPSFSSELARSNFGITTNSSVPVQTNASIVPDRSSQIASYSGPTVQTQPPDAEQQGRKRITDLVGQMVKRQRLAASQ